MITTAGAKHPAKFSRAIIDEIQGILAAYEFTGTIIDPFAGTGRVHQLSDTAVGVEIEPEWAEMHPRTIVGNVLALPFADATFDALASSPCYGNRLADSHNAKDASRRHSYTHDLGRKLHPDNSGTIHWGDSYRNFHDRAWTESLRVLKDDALIVLNVSNHIRNFEEQFVTEWHLNWFLDHGCKVRDLRRVSTQRMRFGQNHVARVDHENILVLAKDAPSKENM